MGAQLYAGLSELPVKLVSVYPLSRFVVTALWQSVEKFCWRKLVSHSNMLSICDQFPDSFDPAEARNLVNLPASCVSSLFS